MAVALAATLLALLLTMPLALHPTTYIYGYPGDSTGAIGIFWWWGYALTHGKNLLDNSVQGVPLGSDWSKAAFSPLPIVIFAPLTVLLGPILSYNLLILSGFPLTAWTTFHLARRLGLTIVGATFSALSFAFTPYHIQKAMGHGNQTHLEFLVGGLLMLVLWRASGRLRYAAAAGALLGLQVWWEPSITYVMVFALGTFFLVSGIVGLVREPDRIRVLLGHFRAALLMAIVTLPFIPVATYFLRRPGTPGAAAGLTTRSLLEVTIYSAHLHEYLQPYYYNPLVPQFIKNWELAGLHGSNFYESTILLGYTVILLGLVGLIMTRRVFPIALSAGLVLVGALVAGPPVRVVFGRTLHMPSYYLFEVLPSFRVYARFAWMVLLGGSVLAGMGLAILAARLGSGRWRAVLVAPFLLLAIEFNNMPPTRVTQLLPAPAAYTWLRGQPAGVLLEYPANSGDGTIQEIQIHTYLLYQMVHMHPTFLTEITTGAASQEAKRLEPYYAPGVVDQLKSLGVRYVFVHVAEYQADGYNVPHLVDGLTYVRSFDGIDAFTVD